MSSFFQEDIVVDITKKLIQFYPFYATQGIREAQDYIAHLLSQRGWQTVLQDSFYASDISNHPSFVNVSAFGHPYLDYEHVEKHNVIALYTGHKDGPTLILNGHIDVDIVDESQLWFTQEGWKLGEIHDNRLYGRGACDMLGGLSAMVVASCDFIKNYPLFKGRLIFTSVCDEEIGGNGTLRSLLCLEKSLGTLTDNTYAVIAEPSQNQICNQSLGFMHLTSSFNSLPIHMGVASKKNNSLYDALDYIKNFETYLKSSLKTLNQLHLFDLFRYNFGKIQGGIDAAIPIGDIHLEKTIFYPEEIEVNLLYEELKNIVEKNHSVTVHKSHFGFKGASFNKDYKNLKHQNCSALFPSPCDARLFKEFGIPTIIYGPGSLEQAHSTNEYIDLDELKDYAKSFYAFLCSFFQVHE